MTDLSKPTSPNCCNIFLCFTDPVQNNLYEEFQGKRSSLLFQVIAHSLVCIFLLSDSIYRAIYFPSVMSYSVFLLAVLVPTIAGATLILKIGIAEVSPSLKQQVNRVGPWLESAWAFAACVVNSLALYVKVLNGECNGLEWESQNLGCNKSAQLPENAVFFGIMLPVMFALVAKGARWRYVLAAWSISVAVDITLLVQFEAYLSLVPCILWFILSFTTLFEHQRQSISIFLLAQGQQKLIDENVKMADEIQANELRHMIGNVAHDLKTPLSAFMSGLEVISDSISEVKDLVLDNKFYNHRSRLYSISTMHSNSQISIKTNTTTAATPSNRSSNNSGSSSSSGATNIGNNAAAVMIEEDEQLTGNALLEHEEKYSKLRKLLAVIRSTTKNIQSTNSFMTMTINRCIDYTKASRGLKLVPQQTTGNLQEIISLPMYCMKNLQNRVKIVLKPIPKDIFPYIITDVQWLQENILCLLSNAVKYSSKGSVTICVALCDANDSDVSSIGSNSSSGKLKSASTADCDSQQQHPHHLRTRSSSSATTIITPSSCSPSPSSLLTTATAPTTVAVTTTSATTATTTSAATASTTATTSSSNNVAAMTPRYYSAAASLLATAMSPTAAAASLAASLSAGTLTVVPSTASLTAVTPLSAVMSPTAANKVPIITHMLKISVEDTGIGLSEEEMKNLFNPFKQAQRMAGGTGLGLFSLAKRVEALQGRYGVQKRLDGLQGSYFWFTIPHRPDTSYTTTNTSTPATASRITATTTTRTTATTAATSISSTTALSPIASSSAVSLTASIASTTSSAAGRVSSSPPDEGQQSRSHSLNAAVLSLSAASDDDLDSTSASTCSPYSTRPVSLDVFEVPIISDHLIAAAAATTSSHFTHSNSAFSHRCGSPIIPTSPPTVSSSTAMTTTTALPSLLMPDMMIRPPPIRIPYRNSNNSNNTGTTRVGDYDGEETPGGDGGAGDNTHKSTSSSSSDATSRGSHGDGSSTFRDSISASPSIVDTAVMLGFEGFTADGNDREGLLRQNSSRCCYDDTGDDDLLCSPRDSQETGSGGDSNRNSNHSNNNNNGVGGGIGNSNNNSHGNSRQASAQNTPQQMLRKSIRVPAQQQSQILLQMAAAAAAASLSPPSSPLALQLQEQEQQLQQQSIQQQQMQMMMVKNLDAKLNVLIVDDSMSIQKMTSMLLKSKGYRTSTAENGADALDKILDQRSVYDVVLMDFQMPVMDGLEATRRLRCFENEAFAAAARQHQEYLQQQQLRRDDNSVDTAIDDVDPTRDSKMLAHRLIPPPPPPRRNRQMVIGVSANSDHETMQEGFAAGIDAFISKPFTWQTFRETYTNLCSNTTICNDAIN